MGDKIPVESVVVIFKSLIIFYKLIIIKKIIISIKKKFKVETINFYKLVFNFYIIHIFIVK